MINRKTNRKLGYGDLIADACLYEVPQNPVLKSPGQFKRIGKAAQRPDIPDKVTGKAVYKIDVQVPGQVVACILHSPTIHGKIQSIDDTAARKIGGVLDVIRCERPMPHRKSEAVAVIATHYWAALQGRKALRVEWEPEENPLSTLAYVEQLYRAVADPGLVHVEKGNFSPYFREAAHKLESVYETPFVAHVPKEPENATVHVKPDGTVEVWAPVQGPDWVKGDIAKYLSIAPEKIQMHVTLLGGSFGRKAYHDFLLEACCLSRQLHKPVQVIWSREDDLTQGPYRAGMLSHLQGTFSGNLLTGFHHHAIGESIDGQVNNSLKPGIADPVLCGEIDFENSKYVFEHAKISYSRVQTDIPIVWWRSIYASNFAWGQECFVDELAHAAGLDPLEARLHLLSDDRYRRILQFLAGKARYGEKLPAGMAMGIALWKCFGTISAACITVSRTDARIRIDKVVSVIDCGMYVNPDTVKAQTEGNIVMGSSAAIKGGITFADGRCQQSNFNQYHVLRIPEVPPMEVYLMESELEPGGVGEPGLPPIAPALGNAIFNLTGQRIKKLPIDINGL